MLSGRSPPRTDRGCSRYPPAGQHEPWSLSLYLGGLTVGLALGGAVGRNGVSDRPGGPGWYWSRRSASRRASAGTRARSGGCAGWPKPRPLFGAHDPRDTNLRLDAFVNDGFGSPYGVLAAILPGFAVFRYPGKLLTFTVLAVSVLAGLGWDLLVRGQTRWPARWCAWGLAVTLVVLPLWIAAGPWVATWLAARNLPEPIFGPLDIPGALLATRRSLIHGAIVLALGLGLTNLAPRWPRRAGAAALVALALDLGVANAGMIWSVPQASLRRPVAGRPADRRPGAAAIPRRGRSASTASPTGCRTTSPAEPLARAAPRAGRAGSATPWHHSTPCRWGFTMVSSGGTWNSSTTSSSFARRCCPPTAGPPRCWGFATGRRCCTSPDGPSTSGIIATSSCRSTATAGLPGERGFATFLPDTKLIYPDAAA